MTAGDAWSGLKIARSLVLLARLPFGLALLVVPLLGFGMAHWDYAKDLTASPALAFVLAAWFVGSAATLWLNASLDGDDEKGALFARAAPRPPHLAAYAYIGLAASVALASFAGARVGVLCALTAALSILYSHPKTMWKAHALLGPLVNGVGYGVLSLFAGWSVVGVALDLRTAASFVLLAVFMTGATFASQAFQREDDARRGYRTLVVTHGPRACLSAARACTLVSVSGVAVLSALGYFPRLCLLGVPSFLVADRWLVRWRALPDGGTAKHAAGFVLRMLGGAALLVALAYVDYGWAYFHGQAVAGRGTVRGVPE